MGNEGAANISYNILFSTEKQARMIFIFFSFSFHFEYEMKGK